MEEQRIIILHGFTAEEAVAAMRSLKESLPAAKDAAFAMSTPTNLQWKLADLIEHIGEEDRQFKNKRDKGMA
jgi:hypothetical protein